MCVKDRQGVAEFANDLDGRLLNFFRVLQNLSLFQYLVHRLESTPFSSLDYTLASSILDSSPHPLVPDVDLAWAFFVVNRQSRQALGKDYATPSSRLRRNRNENVSSFRSAIDNLTDFRNRLLWVELLQMDVCSCIQKLDRPDTFFFVDPPYVKSTRIAGGYSTEMDFDDHVRLLDTLAKIEGKFMLCGYDSELYKDYESRHVWHRFEFPTVKHSSSSSSKPKSIEILWLNYTP